MPLTEIFGFTAACLTTIAFVPQAWLTWRSRRVHDVSLGMYSILSLGQAMWLAYGVLIDAWPVIAANAVSLLLAVSILSMKIRYR